MRSRITGTLFLAFVLFLVACVPVTPAPSLNPTDSALLEEQAGIKEIDDVLAAAMPDEFHARLRERSAHRTEDEQVAHHVAAAPGPTH